MNEKTYINSLVTAVRIDLARGMDKELVLRALSRVISRDLFQKVLERV